MKILLIEDDEPIAEAIRAGLQGFHYTVDVARNGQQGYEMAQEGSYFLILLDIMLPKMDGWRVCEALRASRNQVPILMLTARDEIDDRVRGLELGADDYLAKPFAFPELLARVRALLRRDHTHRTRVILIADLEVDTGLRRVWRAGQEIALTPHEYTLLEAMVSREGVALSREFVQEHIWLDEDSYSNTVDVCIRYLRQKIDIGHDIRLIQTVHRQGYMIKRSETPHSQSAGKV